MLMTTQDSRISIQFVVEHEGMSSIISRSAKDKIVIVTEKPVRRVKYSAALAS